MRVHYVAHQLGGSYWVGMLVSEATLVGINHQHDIPMVVSLHEYVKIILRTSNYMNRTH